MQKLLYPNLWNGCVGAWCPSQQRFPTTQLVDYSANNRHGTLTNMDAATDWVASQGKMALDFDGSNDYVSVPAVAVDSLSFSISLWARQVGAAATGMPIGNMSTINSYLWFRSSNYLRVAFPSGNVEFSSVTTFQSMSHYAITGRFGGTGLSAIGLSVNNVAQTPINALNSTFTISGIGGGYSGNSFPFPGQIDDVRIYNRALTPSEISLLALRRGIAYEQVRNRKYKVAGGGGGGGFKSYWASNNSASIGCGV
jgi:hypothetical protein